MKTYWNTWSYSIYCSHLSGSFYWLSLLHSVSNNNIIDSVLFKCPVSRSEVAGNTRTLKAKMKFSTCSFHILHICFPFTFSMLSLMLSTNPLSRLNTFGIKNLRYSCFLKPHLWQDRSSFCFVPENICKSTNFNNMLSDHLWNVNIYLVNKGLAYDYAV